ncbi:N6 adenine-specific DNA methyltransferase, D21 class like protein, partial [Aduncisulcus paluster]
NFIGSLIWENRSVANDSQNLFSTTHEYILIYAKNKELVQFKGEEKDLSSYTNPDNDPNGDWTADNPTAASGNENSRFTIRNPLTGEEYFPPKGRFWAFSKKRVEEWYNSGKIVFPKEIGKRFLLKKYKGTKELKSLYPEGLPFKHPKPTDLLVKLFEQISEDGDIILDPFAGSASTAHAVFKLNHKENTSRKFICIQNDEALALNPETISLGFTNLSEVAHDRIERAGKLFSSENVGFNYLKLTFEQE